VLGLVTDQTVKANAPTDYLLQDWAAAGLRVASAFRAFLVTVPRSAVLGKTGRLSDRDWQEVRRCVRTALDVA
jgi:mRNA interferase MazF